MASEDDTSAIVQEMAGVPDGTQLDTGETVVADLDEDGNVLGWHKEPA